MKPKARLLTVAGIVCAALIAGIVYLLLPGPAPRPAPTSTPSAAQSMLEHLFHQCAGHASCTPKP